jgi:VanZ family protein
MPCVSGGRLSRYLTMVTVVFIIHASLYPWVQWRDTGVGAWRWMSAPWPYYWTWFDVLANVVAYVPLGFFAASGWRGQRGMWAAVAWATWGAALLSATLETTQVYMVTRIASNVDCAGNVVGALIGAVCGARWGSSLMDTGCLGRWRARFILAGSGGDWGLILAGFWLLAALAPQQVPLGNGDMRYLLAFSPALALDANQFRWLEAAIVGTHAFAWGIVVCGFLLQRAPVWGVVLLALALILKTLALVTSLGWNHAIDWMTPGCLIGLAVGLACWWGVIRQSWHFQQAVGAGALILALGLVNLAPDNPYRLYAWAGWDPGPLLSFFGLTSLSATVWPFMALIWLVIIRRKQEDRVGA